MKQNMKIGILTFYYGSKNYGGMLQAYALTHYLKSHGHDAEQICYVNSSRPFLNRLQEKKEDATWSHDSYVNKTITNALLKKLYYKFYGNKQNEIASQILAHYVETERNERAKNFEKFEKEVPHSDIVYDASSISDSNNIYDSFIAGSDQVWNFLWFDENYFLRFANKNKIKLAYGASTGKIRFCEEEKKYLTESLPELNAISVREQDMVSEISALSKKNAIQVVDPVFLLAADEWDKIASPRQIKEKYLLCYYLTPSDEFYISAKKFAKKKHLKLVSIPYANGGLNEIDGYYGDFRCSTAALKDFISLIKFADYIFTDSFHAVAFSIIYNKNFFVFDRCKNREMGTRIASVTELFDCKNQYCTDEKMMKLNYLLSNSKHKEYNKEKFDRLLSESEEFLKASLQK